MRGVPKWLLDRTLVPIIRKLVRTSAWRYVHGKINWATASAEPPSPKETAITSELGTPAPSLSPPKTPQQKAAAQYLGAQPWRFPNLIGRVAEPDLQSSAELIRLHLDKVILMATETELRHHALLRAPSDGLLLEFGVFKGASINYMAKLLARNGDPRTLHGFDSFEGLSDDGFGWVWNKGRFSTGGSLPSVEPNVQLHKGWIDDTLPPFLAAHPDQPIAFIHVDVDIYQPAYTILSQCKHRLRPGSIIVFDELVGYAGWQHHEYKALTQVFDEREYDFISFSDFFQAAVIITDIQK